MLFLTCPHCEERIIIPIGVGGRFEKMDCPSCDKVMFVHHSRWRPHVYKVAQVKVDEEKNTIEIVDLEALKEFEDDYSELGQTLEELKGYRSGSM